MPDTTTEQTDVDPADMNAAMACGIVREHADTERNDLRARIFVELRAMAVAEARDRDQRALGAASRLEQLAVALRRHIEEHGL